MLEVIGLCDLGGRWLLLTCDGAGTAAGLSSIASMRSDAALANTPVSLVFSPPGSPVAALAAGAARVLEHCEVTRADRVGRRDQL